MEKDEIRIRVFREMPFAWQSKNILRHIQRSSRGQKLTSRMSVYLALTQVASDSSAEEYETWGVKIMEMSGVGYSTLRNIFNEFEEMRIIKRDQERTKQGTFGKLEVILLEPEFTDSQSQPIGKLRHKAGHKPMQCDLQSIEDNIENNKENSIEVGKNEFLRPVISENSERDKILNKANDFEVSISEEKDVNYSLGFWSSVNRSFASFYKNKTQRKAQRKIHELYGKEMFERVIKLIPQTNKIKYAPTITKPTDLLEKWASLESFCVKEKNSKENNSKQVFTA